MGVVGEQEEAVSQSMTWFPGEAQRTRVAACEGVSGRRVVEKGVCPQDPSVPKNPGVWARVLGFVYGLQAAIEFSQTSIAFHIRVVV